MKKMRFTIWAGALSLVLSAVASARAQDRLWIEYRGGAGPGHGKKIVLISGDEEYRSEESMPMLAKILARRHGFDCTVLFAVNKATGEIDPETLDNIPGLAALDNADLAIFDIRFRNLPDDQMKHIDDYIRSGRPIIGIRTATHSFQIKNKNSPYCHWTWTSMAPRYEGGFGRQILGETWINHHGHHKVESTRALLVDSEKDRPLVRGCADIWTPTDVYEVRLPLPGDSKPIYLGAVLTNMKPTDPPVAGPKNHPMMPVVWIKSYQAPDGKKGRAFTTTMGASQDFLSAGLRRLLVNAVYWGLGMEEKIPAENPVAFVSPYRPSPFSFGGQVRGLRPADYQDIDSPVPAKPRR